MMIFYMLNYSTRSCNNHIHIFFHYRCIYILPPSKQITTTQSDQSRFLTSTIKKKRGGKLSHTLLVTWKQNLRLWNKYIYALHTKQNFETCYMNARVHTNLTWRKTKISSRLSQAQFSEVNFTCSYEGFLIGHFPVPPGLCIKTRLSAQLLL